MRISGVAYQGGSFAQEHPATWEVPDTVPLKLESAETIGEARLTHDEDGTVWVTAEVDEAYGNALPLYPYFAVALKLKPRDWDVPGTPENPYDDTGARLSFVAVTKGNEDANLPPWDVVDAEKAKDVFATYEAATEKVVEASKGLFAKLAEDD